MPGSAVIVGQPGGGREEMGHPAAIDTEQDY